MTRSPQIRGGADSQVFAHLALNQFLLLAQVKERLHAKPTRVMDRSSNESSSSTISKDSEVENLVVGTDEATNLASALHALHKLLPSGAESDMTSLASALLRMTHGAPGQVDSLTGACRSTSDALLRLEYV